MVIRYNRDYSQNRADVVKEFPHHRVLMLLDENSDDTGRLLATSSSAESSEELCNIMHEYPINTHFLIGGFYADSMSVGVIDFV